MTPEALAQQYSDVYLGRRGAGRHAPLQAWSYDLPASDTRAWGWMHGKRVQVPLDQDVLAGLYQACQDDGREEFRLQVGQALFRVTQLATVTGNVFFALRSIQPVVPQVGQLGLPLPIAQMLVSEQIGPGLLLFVGGMGQGKTTSASAVLIERLRRFGGVSLAIEDPAELLLDGEHGEGICFQQEIDRHLFADHIVRAMRQGISGRPTQIFLGEIRSPEIAREAIRAGVNGHPVISTLHAGNIPQALYRLKELSGQGDDAWPVIAEGLTGIVHQTLMRSPDGRKRPMIDALFLTKDNATSVRAKIRAGKIEQIRTDIDAQKIALALAG